MEIIKIITLFICLVPNISIFGMRLGRVTMPQFQATRQFALPRSVAPIRKWGDDQKNTTHAINEAVMEALTTSNSEQMRPLLPALPRSFVDLLIKKSKEIQIERFQQVHSILVDLNDTDKENTTKEDVQKLKEAFIVAQNATKVLLLFEKEHEPNKQ